MKIRSFNIKRMFGLTRCPSIFKDINSAFSSVECRKIELVVLYSYEYKMYFVCNYNDACVLIFYGFVKILNRNEKI